MAATLKIYFNESSVQTDSSGNRTYWLYYTVVCTTTGSTQATNATMTVAHGGTSNPTGTGTVYGLNIPANSQTPVYRIYQHTQASSGSATLNVTLNLGSYGTVSASKSVTLGQATEATAYVYMPYRMTLGESFDITVRGSSARTYDVRCYMDTSYGGARGSYFTILDGVEAGTHTATISPSQMSSYMADVASMQVSIQVVAYSSAGDCVALGDDNSATYLDMPSSAVPTISSVTTSDTEGYLSEYGVYVQYWSALRIVIEASGIYGSTVTDITASIDGASAGGTSTTKDLGVLTVSGSRTLTIKVTDSRGRTSTTTRTLTVGAYTAPTIGSFVAQRWADGAEDDSSDTVRLTTSGSLCTINGHALTGTATFRGRKNEVGTDFSVIDSSSLAGAFSLYRDVTGQDVESSYVYELTVTDSFGSSVTVTAQVGTSRPIMDFHVGGEAMGMWTTAREAKYQDGTDATGLFIDNDIIFSEGRGVSGAGGSETGQMVYARLMQASYNYSTDSFILEMLQHLVLANGKHVAGRNASGGITRLLGINESGEVELNWTSGGLKGRVMKLLWSGTLSVGGSATIADLPYYNVFGICMSTAFAVASRTLGWNSSYVVATATIPYNDTSADAENTHRAFLSFSGTKATLNKSRLYNPITGAYIESNVKVTQIYGIL